MQKKQKKLWYIRKVRNTKTPDHYELRLIVHSAESAYKLHNWVPLNEYKKRKSTRVVVTEE